jgi:hypothetical protein
MQTTCKSCGKTFNHISIFEEVTSCWKCNDNEIINMTHKETKMNEPSDNNQLLTLPLESKERKNYPLFRGCLRYFPAALAGVSRISKLGNDKHNPGEEMHHARNKSSDHGDCILRHLIDIQDLLAAKERGVDISTQQILDEVSCLAWRSLAMSQELHESLNNIPLAPGAKKDGK